LFGVQLELLYSCSDLQYSHKYNTVTNTYLNIPIRQTKCYNSTQNDRKLVTAHPDAHPNIHSAVFRWQGKPGVSIAAKGKAASTRRQEANGRQQVGGALSISS
jgi:hypothetical protein